MMFSNIARNDCIGANPSANPMYGNEFDYGGPKMVESVQYVNDLIYKYNIMPKAELGMNEDQVFQMFISGQTAFYMTEPGIVDPIKLHNQEIASGQLKGQPVDITSVVLPAPYNPPCKTTADTRPWGIMVYQQADYKGDAHTKIVSDFAQYLVSTDAMVLRYQENGQAPATQSAFAALPALQTDEYAQGFYAILKLASTPNPPNHPNWMHLYWDIIYPLSQSVLSGAMTPQAAVDKWTQQSVADMAFWVKQNPDVATQLQQVPPASEWPGPLFECDRGIPENYNGCTTK
jgi:ABC-type glycerol-3-phosphate transport system substrate-binding protein